MSDDGAAGDGGFEIGRDGPSAILVGVDGSITAIRAAWYAGGLARRQRASLIVVYVTPVAGAVATAPMGAPVMVVEKEAYEEVATYIQARADEMGAELGIPVTFVSAHGDAYHEIKRIAAETRADAIVVGASAQAGHRLVGSLAVRLVRAGQWPVTVVP